MILVLSVSFTRAGRLRPQNFLRLLRRMLDNQDADWCRHWQKSRCLNVKDSISTTFHQVFLFSISPRLLHMFRSGKAKLFRCRRIQPGERERERERERYAAGPAATEAPQA